jgi:hypothetical protein
MKITIFQDITASSPLKFNRRFERIYRSHLLATCFHASFLPGLFFEREEGGNMFLGNVGLQRTTRRYIPEDITLRNYVMFEHKVDIFLE